MEIQLSGRKYTWSNNQEDPTFALLDRVLVSPSWEENFPLVTVTALTRELLDHVPLFISTGEGLKIQRNFKFENCWFLRDDLEGIITKIWNQVYSQEPIWFSQGQIHSGLCVLGL